MAIEIDPYHNFGVKSRIPYFVGVNEKVVINGIFYGYNPKAVSEIKVKGKPTYINPLLRSTYKDDGYLRIFYTRRLPFFPFKNETITYSDSDYLGLKDCLISPTTSNNSSSSDYFNPRF